MTPKGANLQATDLLEISEVSGNGYITKSITGQEIINAGGGGGSQDLQQVTDIGSTTTNPITVTAGANEATTVSGIDITTENTFANTHVTLRDTGEIALRTGSEESSIQNTNASNPGVILEFPDKATGSYTIATEEDLTSGYVPYTGATADVDLGTFHFDAAKGTFSHNGSTDTLTANHTSGSGIGLLITKGGNNEGLKVNKTSGSGNAATIIGTLEATTIVKTGGTSTQFLMADGSITSNLLTALGWFTYNRVAESSAVTGTIVETIIENITIPANTYLNGGILRLYNLKVRKVGANGVTTAMKIYIGPNSNNLSGATQIGLLSGTLFSGVLFFEMLRTFTCTTSNLLGFAFSSSSNTDTITSTIARGSVAVDWTIPQYIIITIQAASLLDSYTLIGASAKNF
jgi:hypothetical protein